MDDAAEVVRLCRTHWETLGRSGGIVVANPVPADVALPWEDVDRHIRVIEAGSARIADEYGRRTPILLSELVRQTAGRSIDANIALLSGNAELASRIAVAACESA